MTNPWGRKGAPMLQPTKPELWARIAARDDRIAELERDLAAAQPPDLLKLLGLEKPKPTPIHRRF
jgi:hypothetical protein